METPMTQEPTSADARGLTESQRESLRWLTTEASDDDRLHVLLELEESGHAEKLRALLSPTTDPLHTSALAAGYASVADWVAAMVGALEGADNIFRNCTVEYGCCCCGDSMEGHADPMACGHSPVDMGAYQVDQWMQPRAALTKGQPDGK